jgi:hypothetical protein
MRTITLAVCLTIFAAACNYSHVGTPTTTFSRATPPLGTATNEAPGGPLVLRISRHLDEVLKGPDVDEDQLLVLTVQDYQIGKKLEIPSENVTPEFTVTRFGPHSRGDTFTGYLVLRKVTAHKVDATVHLDVTAHTASGSYTQTAKFHGEYRFVYVVPDPDLGP